MYTTDPIRLAQAQFFETALQRNPALEQERPDRAISADQACLEFIDQIHSSMGLPPAHASVNGYRAETNYYLRARLVRSTALV